MAKITVNIQALDRLIRNVDRAKVKAMNLDFTEAKALIEDEIEARFESGGYGRWEPITPATTRLRRKALEGKPPLGGTSGRLFKSLSLQKARGKNSIDIKFNHPGAEPLNYGAPNNKMFGLHPAPIPPRRFMMVSRETRKEIKDDLVIQIFDAFFGRVTK